MATYKIDIGNNAILSDQFTSLQNPLHNRSSSVRGDMRKLIKMAMVIKMTNNQIKDPVTCMYQIDKKGIDKMGERRVCVLLCSVCMYVFL